MDQEVSTAKQALADLQEQLSAQQNTADQKQRVHNDARKAYEDVLSQRQRLANEYVTASVSMGFLEEKQALAKLSEVASGGSHKGLSKPLQDYFIVCTREEEAKKQFDEAKDSLDEAKAVIKHLKADTDQAREHLELLEQQSASSGKQQRATRATVMADSEVAVSKQLPAYAVVRSHGRVHGDPEIRELRFLMEQMILQQSETIALIRQEKDAAVAAAQREKDEAIAALRKERDSALSTLMNAQLQVEEMKSNNNPYAKVASSAYAHSSSPAKGNSAGTGTHHHGSGDYLYSVSYLTNAVIQNFGKARGPPAGVLRAMHDFELWPQIRRDMADYIMLNTGAAAYNSAGRFIGKPIHPWLRDRATELGITVEFKLPRPLPAANDPSMDSYPHFGGNGIIHTLATNFGRSEWRNPAEAGYITITRSSDGRYSEPVSACVGRDGAYCFTGDEPNSWFTIDFGPTRLVWPSAYSLRHGYSSSSHFLRDWVFEGSLDQDTWHVVANHVNDKHLNNTGYAESTWNVGRAPPPAGFRYLRVRQTGRNSSSKHDLYVAGFEVYGKFLNSLKKIKVHESSSASKSSSKAQNGRGNRKSKRQQAFLPAVS